MKEKTESFNNIRKWLVPLLEAKGLSVEEFARKVGVSKASIYYYCNDTCRPDEAHMKRMCDILDRPYEEGLAQYTQKQNGRPSQRDDRARRR